MKTEERKTLVTNEGEIKVGDLIEVHRCVHCSMATHRFLITRVLPAMPRVYGLTPRTDCMIRFPSSTAVLVNAVLDRKVFIIDVGLLAEENPYTTKSRPSGVDYEKHRQMVRAHFDSRAVLKRLGKVSPQ